MASKRRNMFHKNKTQETTEKDGSSHGSQQACGSSTSSGSAASCKMTSPQDELVEIINDFKNNVFTISEVEKLVEAWRNRNDVQQSFREKQEQLNQMRQEYERIQQAMKEQMKRATPFERIKKFFSRKSKHVDVTVAMKEGCIGGNRQEGCGQQVCHRPVSSLSLHSSSSCSSCGRMSTGSGTSLGDSGTHSDHDEKKSETYLGKDKCLFLPPCPPSPTLPTFRHPCLRRSADTAATPLFSANIYTRFTRKTSLHVLIRGKKKKKKKMSDIDTIYSSTDESSVPLSQRTLGKKRLPKKRSKPSSPTSPQRPVKVYAPGTPPEEAHEDLPCTSSAMEHPITLPGITPATVLSDTTGNHPDAASASATATCKPPPIHIAEVSDFVGLCTAIAALVGPDGFECKSRLREVMVSPSTPSNYRAIVKYLSTKNLPYHTYQIKTEKAYRVVIRDLNQNIPLDIIRREIENHGHRVRAVSNVLHPKTKERLPLFFVDLEPASNNSDIFKIPKIYFSSIRVEEPHKRRDIVQCTRCQQYRHTKGYCNRPARCVRCGRDHDSATCEKSRDTPATCALCGGDHPANYKGCTVYKDLQKISKPVGYKRDIPPPTSEPATTDGGRSSSYPPAPPAVSRPPPRAVVAVPPARSRPTDTTTARVIVPIVNNPDNKNKKFSQIKPHIHPAPPSFAQVVSKRKNRPATTTTNSTPQRAQPKTPQTLPPTGPSSTPVAHSSTTTPVFSIQIVTALASFTNEFRSLASDLIAALTSLSSLLTTLTSANLTISRFLSGGDYNCKHPTWGSRVATPRGRMLYRVINQNGYDTISPDNPTYWPTHPNRLPDVLDFFITSGLRGIHSLSQVLNDLSSDHSPVLLTTSLDPILELPPPILTPGYTDWNSFTQSLDSVIDLRVPLKTPEDLDEAVQEFTLAVQRTARTSSQPPTPKYNTQSINLPQHIRLLITHKRRARSKWQRTRYPSDRQHYEQLAHELRSELSSFRSDTYNSYIISLSTHDRSFWDSTKRLLRSHPTPSPLRHPDNSWARSDEDKAQLFANHLRSIFQPSPESDPIHSHQVQKYLDSPLPLTLPPSPFSPSEVTYAIQHLPRKKSPGYDLITGEILRHLPRRAILFLTYLYNAILRTTYFPLLWKFAHIKMIPKPNKLHTEPSAYRPISLLPIFSKLFEKLFLKRLVPIFESQNIIPSHQFGFRPFHSTIHQCLHIVDIISSSLEQKQYCGAAFLDVEQAFDRVWHPGLLYKLKKILPSTYYLILQSYLKDRYSDFIYHEKLQAVKENDIALASEEYVTPSADTTITAIPKPPNTTVALVHREYVPDGDEEEEGRDDGEKVGLESNENRSEEMETLEQSVSILEKMAAGIAIAGREETTKDSEIHEVGRDPENGGVGRDPGSETGIETLEANNDPEIGEELPQTELPDYVNVCPLPTPPPPIPPRARYKGVIL
ncbi:hypothetical protein AAG570_002584 [Ranatra chinensis]|uniref:Reverse transcriptase domain-containing protein n=1 Tax=Ranatra chinensis TaxID=642074 RepID=A0ABD0Y809_9HEMI